MSGSSGNRFGGTGGVGGAGGTGDGAGSSELVSGIDKGRYDILGNNGRGGRGDGRGVDKKVETGARSTGRSRRRSFSFSGDPALMSSPPFLVGRGKGGERLTRSPVHQKPRTPARHSFRNGGGSGGGGAIGVEKRSALGGGNVVGAGELDARLEESRGRYS